MHKTSLLFCETKAQTDCGDRDRWRAAGIRVRPSQGDRVCVDALAQMRADAPVAEHLDVSAKQVFEILPEPDEVEQAAPWLHLHEQIYVAVRLSFASGSGAEHSHVARTVLGRAPQYL
jgi:hypothetical protein